MPLWVPRPKSQGPFNKTKKRVFFGFSAFLVTLQVSLYWLSTHSLPWKISWLPFGRLHFIRQNPSSPPIARIKTMLNDWIPKNGRNKSFRQIFRSTTPQCCLARCAFASESRGKSKSLLHPEREAAGGDAGGVKPQVELSHGESRAKSLEHLKPYRLPVIPPEVFTVF